MPKFVLVLLAVVVGYVVGAVVGYFLVQLLSGNQHDKSVEAAMTAGFVVGPLGAIIAGVVAFMRTRG